MLVYWYIFPLKIALVAKDNITKKYVINLEEYVNVYTHIYAVRQQPVLHMNSLFKQ
jgi:hypothetical protein